MAQFRGFLFGLTIIAVHCNGAPLISSYDRDIAPTTSTTTIKGNITTVEANKTIITTTPSAGVGGIRIFNQYSRGHGYRDWRTRGDPTLINSLWKSRQPLGIRKQLGNAEVYIILALLIGFATVLIGCWLSDNCWSPDPEELPT